MSKIEKEVAVNAPVEEVFNYVSDPRNLPEFWPSLIDVKDVKSLANGGYSGRWVYKMAGMHFEGIAEYTEVVPNQWLVIETQGGIRSIITWTFRSNVDETRVTLTIEYKIPVPLLGRLAEAIIVKWNEQEGDLMLAHLQAKFSSG